MLVAIKVPHIFNRKPTDLYEVGNWKSSEIYLFLFYESIPLLLNTMYSCDKQIDKKTKAITEINKQHTCFYQYAAYIIAIRILYEPIQSESDLKLGENILIMYCKAIEDSFDINACTYTLHAHLHLVDQVRRLGNLREQEQFIFEVFFILTLI